MVAHNKENKRAHPQSNILRGSKNGEDMNGKVVMRTSGICDGYRSSSRELNHQRTINVELIAVHCERTELAQHRHIHTRRNCHSPAEVY